MQPHALEVVWFVLPYFHRALQGHLHPLLKCLLLNLSLFWGHSLCKIAVFWEGKNWRIGKTAKEIGILQKYNRSMSNKDFPQKHHGFFDLSKCSTYLEVPGNTRYGNVNYGRLVCDQLTLLQRVLYLCIAMKERRHKTQARQKP